MSKYAPWLCLGLYFYSVFINSIRLGIKQTFNTTGEQIDTIFQWNPFLNTAALFSPTGLGVTFFIGIMFVLFNKRAYKFFTGDKSFADKRGFDIVPEGTYGTSGFMSRKEMSRILDIGKVDETASTILGKMKTDAREEDEEADYEYVSPKTNNGLNDHILVFGASGAGKSRGFVKPFALQCAKRKESIILVDPKGEFYEELSEFYKSEGYVVKALNLLDMINSDGWNCFWDIQSDKNLVQTISEEIIRNTSNASERQDFWEKAEHNLLMALIHYVQGLKVPGTDRPLPIEQRSLGTIYKLLSGEAFNDLEKRIEELPGSHPAKAPFGVFKQANRQIWGNIAIGLGNRLNVFQNELVDKITKYNEIDLELPGYQPCAYFCIISDQDSSLEFLSSLFFSTLFVRLTNYARRHGDRGRLPIKVNFCLDEFCNIGKLNDFKKLISTVRSRNINIQVIVQSVAQLADRYIQKEWEEIVGNCDTQIFLGCNDEMTADFISKKCGKISVQTLNHMKPVTPLYSPVLHNTRNYSESKSTTQRDLMLPDEVLRLPNNECLILLRGQKPLQLYKITPDELPGFSKIKPVRVVDHIPEWRNNSQNYEVQEKVSVYIKSDADEDLLYDKMKPLRGNRKYEFMQDTRPNFNRKVEDKRKQLSFDLNSEGPLFEDFIEMDVSEIRNKKK